MGNDLKRNKEKKNRRFLTGILMAMLIACLSLFGETFTAMLPAASRQAVEQTIVYGKKKNNSKQKEEKKDNKEIKVEEDGTYTSKEEVAAYIHEFKKLPSNYITKRDAQDLGWDNKKGNLDKVAPGKSIGGDKFGNYEELLPTAKGRKYFECDIDFDGGYRGAKRIIYSNDGLIYYTEDHYKTFEQLY